MSGIQLIRGDITTFEADAIVNAANSGLMGGGGVDGAIHRAGGPAILAECKEWVAEHGRLPTGEAMSTAAGKMPAQHVIHTVGPVWTGGHAGESDLLASAYRSSIEVADRLLSASVAFPSISTGVYGYPVRQAAPVALRAVRDALVSARRVKDVTFVLFDDTTYAAYAQALVSMEQTKGER